MKIELYKAAFPHGALSKGTTIRGTYTYGGKRIQHLSFRPHCRKLANK